MGRAGNPKLEKLLREFEEYPDFVGCRLVDPNDVGNFGNTPLHLAASQGDLSAVLLLLDAGANVNATGEENYTPLHDAVEQGRENIIRPLVEHGARLDLRNSMDMTPFDLAVALQKSEGLKALLKSLGSER